MAFDTLTPEARYWAGFILADGCLRVERRQYSTGTVCFYKSVSIGLAKRDKYHLDKLKLFLGSTHKILEFNCKSTFGTYPMVRLSFLSQRIFDRLSTLGITPGKTKGTVVDSCLADSTDFWRGFVDGDGYITISRSGTLRVPFIGACGHKSIMAQFQNFVRSVTGKTYALTDSSTKCCALKLNGKQAIKLISVLYREATVALDRKRNTAKSIL